MAEEAAAVQADGATESKPAEPTAEELQQQRYEQDASAKGWRPKEEFDGPEGSWVGAEEFLKREPLFDKIKDQGKTIKKLQRTMDAMMNQQQTMVKAQVQLRIKELQAEKRAAIELGDADKVDQLDNQIDAEKQSLKSTEVQPQAPEGVDEWIAANQTWFGKNNEMTDFAVAHNKSYMSRNPGADPMESLKATEQAVKKAYPDQFGKKEEPKPEVPKTPSPVEGGGQPKEGGDKNKYTMSRLSEDQKLVYEQQVKRYKILSHDEFFKGLDEIGELS